MKKPITKTAKKAPPKTKKKGSAGTALSPEDEKALDRAWEKVGGGGGGKKSGGKIAGKKK